MAGAATTGRARECEGQSPWSQDGFYRQQCQTAPIELRSRARCQSKKNWHLGVCKMAHRWTCSMGRAPVDGQGEALPRGVKRATAGLPSGHAQWTGGTAAATRSADLGPQRLPNFEHQTHPRSGPRWPRRVHGGRRPRHAPAAAARGGSVVAPGRPAPRASTAPLGHGAVRAAAGTDRRVDAWPRGG